MARGGRGARHASFRVAPWTQAFAKLVALLRKAGARTLDVLESAIAAALDVFAPDECANYFTASRYKPE
jgi:hypothetical protein